MDTFWDKLGKILLKLTTLVGNNHECIEFISDDPKKGGGGGME